MLFGLIAAILFAFIFSAILAIGFRRRGPGPVGGFLYFFLLILFFSWAGGTWLYPFGPLWGNVPWLGFMVTALFIMLLIALLAPTEENYLLSKGGGKTEFKDAAAITFGLLFWLILIALAIAAVFGTYRLY